MRDVLDVLKAALLLACIACICWLSAFFQAAREAARAVPLEVHNQLVSLRQDTLAEVDKQASGLRADVASQITALRKTADARLNSIQQMVDLHAGNIERIADSRLSGAQGSIDGLRGDLRPVLTNAAALEAQSTALATDLKDSLDANYDDIQATIGSAAVATAGIGRAADEAAKAAPKITQQAERIGNAAAGTAEDVHREADELTAPKTTLQKASDWAKLFARLLAAWF